MRVNLIAQTSFNPLLMQELVGWQADLNSNMQGGEALIEAAGRVCYASWSRPNPATASNAGYIANIIDKQHFSVMRHATATFLVEGVSRSFTHELVTHKHLAHSELSQRYVPMENAVMVIPPAVLDGDTETLQILDALAGAARTAYKRLLDRFTLQGLSHKEARQAARSVLPNMTASTLIVTGNIQAWRQFIAMRATEHADAEMCAIAVQISWELKKAFPNAFQDMNLRSGTGGKRDTVYFGPREDDVLVAGDESGV